MPSSLRPWLLLLLKWLLASAILGGVGWQFWNDLNHPALADLSWRPGWLLLSAVLYLLFVATSSWYWRQLLAVFGPPPPAVVTARAYFVSQLGKYVPGKAWVLILRGALLRGYGFGIAIPALTSFYETLTTMGSGALVAALALGIIDLFLPAAEPTLPMAPVLFALILLAVCAIPLAPPLFHHLVKLVAKKFMSEGAAPLPRIGTGLLVRGILTIGPGWCLLGVSVWAGLASVLPEPPPLDLEVWSRCLGAIGLAYVGGFLAIVMPSGIGVREGVLRVMLAFAGPPPLIVAAVLMTRVAWTFADVLAAGGLWIFGNRQKGKSTAM